MPRPLLQEAATVLRRQASEHPTVGWLKGALPALPATPERSGLYVDASHAPAIAVSGQVRVSVLRIVSVVDGQKVLVGQVQATRSLDRPEEEWALHLFLHVPALFVTLELADDADWFLRTLEMHYAAGGTPVSLPVGVAQ